MFVALVIASLLFLIAAIFILRRERLALYHPLFIFGLWHFIFYLVVPWQIYLLNDWSVFRRFGVPLHSDYYLVKTLFLTQLGFLGTLLGYYSSWGRCWARRWRLPKLTIDGRVAFWVSLVFIIIAAYSIRNYHGIPGVSEPLFNPLSKDEVGRTIMTGASGYAYSGYFFLTGVLLLLFFLFPSRGLGWRVFTLAVFGGYFIFALLRGWHRASWVLCLLGLLTIWLVQRGRRWPSYRFLLAAIPLFIIFNISAVDRDAWKYIVKDKNILDYYIKMAEKRFLEGKMTTADTGNYPFNTFNVMLYSEKISFEYGAEYFNAWIIRPLPRVIFKNKDSYFLPTNISKTNDIYLTAGPTTGLYINYYCNFGTAGVFVGCYVFGIIMRMIWNIFYYYYASGYKYILLLFSSFITFFPQLLRDGINSAPANYFFIFTPIILTIYFTGNRSGRL